VERQPGAAMQGTVAEGTVSGLDTYVLVANPGPVAVTATVTFLLDTGTSVATVVGVPAWNRAAVSATPAWWGCAAGSRWWCQPTARW
jgi:hypothetical protein